MSRPLLLLLALLAGCAALTRRAAVPSPAESELRLAIGSYNVDARDGVEMLQGALLDLTSPERFGVTHVRMAGEEFLLLERISEPDASGSVNARLLQVLRLPAMPLGQTPILAGCRIDGSEDRSIVAIVRWNTRLQWMPDVKRAWRAHGPRGQFEPLPVRGIECENPSWGV